MENGNASTDGMEPLRIEDIIVSNKNCLDTTGREIQLGDLVMVFNDNDPTIDKNAFKWSIEKVVMDEKTCEKVFVFPRFMDNITKPIKNIKSTNLVVIHHDESLIIEDTRFGFKDQNKGFYNFKG